MRLLQKGVCGCPMIFFGWPHLCVGLEAFWQRGFLVYGGYLIYLVARRVVKDTAKADISTHWSVVGCILSGVNHTLGRLRWFHGWCLNLLFNKSVTINVGKSFIPSLTITEVVQRWEVNCLTRQWQKRMRPRNDGSLQCRVIPWNGNVSFIGDLGKRHQLPWMSRSVCTSDCVVIDHRLVWLLPFTKKALEHLEKGSQNHQPWTMTIKQSLIKSLVCSNTACDISSLSSHRDSCRISNSLIISEIYVTCAFLKSHTVRSQESGPLGA